MLTETGTLKHVSTFERPIRHFETTPRENLQNVGGNRLVLSSVK